MKRKILILTDEEEKVYLPAILLQKNDYEVVKTYKITQGVEEAKRIKPDVILLDIQKSIPNNFQTTQNIKKDFELAHIPLILLITPNQKRNAIHSEADLYIEKPINRDLFIWQIEYFTSLHKAEMA
jgi:CheY-like chemotaxis protein